MQANHYKRTASRLCGDSRLVLRVPPGRSPIGGAFVPKDRLEEEQELYPLDLYQCGGCC